MSSMSWYYWLKQIEIHFMSDKKDLMHIWTKIVEFLRCI